MTNFYKKLAMVCTTIALFTFVATSQTTITALMADNNDDCEEFLTVYSTNPAGFMDLTSGDLELCTEHDNDPHIIGLIFRNVQIPVGATITNAYVQFECDEVHLEYPTVNLTVLGAKLANVTAPFAGTDFEISSKPKTTATVPWSPPQWELVSERGPKQQTPNINTIIQEIIGVSGWAPGNNILIMVTDPSTVTAVRTAEAANSGLALAPSLVVTFTEGVGVEDVYGSSVSMYPNPTTGKVTIKNPSTGKFGYAIYNVIGKVVKIRDDIAGSTDEVDMSSSAKGTYFVEVKADAKTFKSKLILK